jgi:hypothetical protein
VNRAHFGTDKKQASNGFRINGITQYQEFILNPLAGSTERANEAGPIWLGYRLNTEKSAGASRLIYDKGGLVLHRLRLLLYDYTRGDDSRFIAIMKEFVQTNAGKEASAADFIAVCDKYFGGDMGWFFEQTRHGHTQDHHRVQHQIPTRRSRAVD